MATRMTRPMIDAGNGTLSESGAPRTPWSAVIASERENAWDDWTFTVEPAQGWGEYRWLVVINDHPYLVDGDTAPTDPGI